MSTTNPVVLKIKLLDGRAVLPVLGTAGASGFDLVSIDDYVLLPGSRVMISTGISIEIPVGYEGQVRPRSGLAAKHGLTVLNSPGTIDCDYRGELKVILFNSSQRGTVEYHVKAGERVAQLVIQQIPNVQIESAAELSSTERGAGGFGSTGQ